MEARILNSVVSTMAEFQREMFVRLSALEDKMGATERAVLEPICEPKKFADIVKEALHESRNDQEQGSKFGIKVKSYGENKTIHNHQVLVVKLKAGTVTNETKTAAATNSIKGALGSIPVNSCRETKTGAIVVKFPTNEAKEEASNAMKACFDGSSDFTISEPRKIMPKITLVGIPISLPDDEILNDIIHKNKEIDVLKEKGCTLELLLTKTKGNSKYAVLKVSPEIRAVVDRMHWFIYVGLSRCRAYDRFWVTQCYHCQRFGHVASNCLKKDQPPTCAFCAGHHASKTCDRKSTPRCANCSNLDEPPGALSHFASSFDCPIMISQRQKVMENTEFSSSKNM